MILVGLGNPGDKYSATKHNFGYWVIDSIIKKSSLKLKAGKGDYLYAQNEDSFLVTEIKSFPRKTLSTPSWPNNLLANGELLISLLLS